MIQGKTISLIIPCRNEAGGIADMLKKVPRFVDEVIVVDNRSTDKTAAIARRHGAIVVKEKRVDRFGIGYGFAHQAGLRVASGDIVVTMDGDETYPLHQVKDVVTYLSKNKLDLVSCSRFPLANGQAISWFRQLGVWILNTEVKLLYRYPIADILSGMWVMDRKAIDVIELQQGGWDLSPEVKLAAIKSKQIRFGEFHIDHAHRDNGASKQKLWQTGFNHLQYIAKRRLTTDNMVWVGLQASFQRIQTPLLRWLYSWAS